MLLPLLLLLHSCWDNCDDVVVVVVVAVFAVTFAVTVAFMFHAILVLIVGHIVGMWCFHKGIL